MNDPLHSWRRHREAQYLCMNLYESSKILQDLTKIKHCTLLPTDSECGQGMRTVGHRVANKNRPEAMLLEDADDIL